MRYARIWLGIAVSAGLLWYAMRNVDLQRAWLAAQGINALFLVPYLAVMFAEVPIRGWRWQLLLVPVQRASLLRLSSATLIGLMANNVLPARLGEFLRAYVGARAEKIPFSTSFATVVIDRVFDGLTVSAIFVFAVVAYPLPDLAKLAGYAAAGIYLGTLLVLVGLIAKRTATLTFVAWLLHWFPGGFSSRVLKWLGSFVGGLQVFRSPRLLLGSVAISLVVWFGYGLSLYLMWLAFDIHLSVIDAFVVLLILTIGLTLPSTPGFVGAMEAAIVTGLAFFGIDESEAFAIAVVYHVTQYVPITLGGFIALWFERMSFTEMAKAGEELAERAQV